MSFWIVPESSRLLTPLSPRGDDEGSENRKDCTVHRHRHARARERDAVEEDFHILDRVDGDAGLANILGDARIITVIAALDRQIESDGKPRLPGGEVTPKESIRLFSRGKTGILPDRPGLIGIHHRPRAAKERRRTRCLHPQMNVRSRL